MKETNIFEIPKIHPFIKMLEKVKELKDNLEEYIEMMPKSFPKPSKNTER